MRLIDADANIETMKKCASNPENEQALLCYRFAQRILEEAPTICCETCKHGIKGERIGSHEYISCTKPYAELSNYHTTDWFCGDWREKDAVD